jgi:hypothetical protein
LREWDRRGVHDLELRPDLLAIFRKEQHLRRSPKAAAPASPELAEVV